MEDTTCEIPLLADWDEYFELPTESTEIYQPDSCIPARYPKLIQAARQRIEKLGYPLFEHSKEDLAQSCLKSRVFNGKPMRMGKTREALSWAKLRGVKKAAFICPKNVRHVVAQEMKAIGCAEDYALINKWRDLNNDKWLDVLTYDWLKRTKDPFQRERQRTFTIEREIQCPRCLKREMALAAKEDRSVNTEKVPFLMRLTKTSQAQPLPKHYRQTTVYGYRCPNKECRYVDFERAQFVAYHIDSRSKYYRDGRLKGKGRMTPRSNIAHSTWVPPRYRRLKKRYPAIIADEIHLAKASNSQQALALRGMRAKNRYGMTGTLMPNDPMDAYWPLYWIFQGKWYLFPYKYIGGSGKFQTDFVQRAKIEGKGVSYKKTIPYLKQPIRFWRMMAPLMIRRSYDDPLVVTSYEKAGLKIPDVNIEVRQIEPEYSQCMVMAATLTAFESSFSEYLKKLTGSKEDQPSQLINSSYVLSQMLWMKIAATCPDLMNEKLGREVYTGAPGGAKMETVWNLVEERTRKGEKVVILSDFRYNQRLLETQLKQFGVIRFDPSWNDQKRGEAFDSFQYDPKYKVFVAGPRAVGLGVDLSAARTVICTDLLWNPGQQQQAYSRILQPMKEKRTCDVIILQTKFSIDRHIYETFYAKQSAAEQALDRRILHRRDKVIDIKAFVDQVLADRGAMLQWLIDTGDQDIDHIPVLQFSPPSDEREV